jgi:hypothetical protein
VICRVFARSLNSLRSFPRPLASLLFAVAVFGIAWALVVPAFDGPDEIQHYTYVETLVQRHKLPGAANGSGPDRNVDQARPTSTTLSQVIKAKHRAGVANPVSTAVLDTIDAMNGDGMTVGIAQPEQSRLAFDRWRSLARHDDQGDGGGTFPGSGYPPGYYAFDAIGYSLAIGGNVVDHLYAARLWSVLCLLLTTVGVWLLAGELTGGRRSMQLVAAAAVGLWPMLSYISAMVNPDALLYATWTWAFWAMAVVIRRGLTAGRLAWLALTTALAFLTKETSIALVPSAAFVLALGFWRLRAGGRQAWLRPALLLLLLVGVPVGGWLGLSLAEHRPLLAQANSVLSGGITDVQQFASYVWEYYLPRLPGQQLHDYYIPVVSSYPAYNIWVASGWGAFGWVTLYFPHGLYPWFLAITVLVALGALTRVGRALWLRRRTPWLRSRALPLAVAFGAAGFLLLAGLHITEYKLQSPTNQGRYLFPLAGLAGMAVALTTRWLPLRLRPAGVGTVIGALVVFQLGSLGYVAAHFYA